MSASSEVQICSNALLTLGASAISSFSDGSAFATAAGNMWPTVRDAVLASHPWKCASKQQTISPESTNYSFDWDYSFKLPSDCLRVLSIGKERDDDPDYEVMDGRVLTNEAIVYLRYVYQLTDVTKYDAMLTQTMTSAMAAYMAYTVTKAQTVQDAMFKLFQFNLKTARTTQGQQDTGQISDQSVLIAARGSTGGASNF